MQKKNKLNQLINAIKRFQLITNASHIRRRVTCHKFRTLELTDDDEGGADYQTLFSLF